MKMMLSRKTAYLGAGAGLVLFAIFGLMPGSILGGAAGIKFAGIFFSLPLEPGLLPRFIVLASMVIGAAVSGIATVTATSAAGWLAGALVEGKGLCSDCGRESRHQAGISKTRDRRHAAGNKKAP